MRQALVGMFKPRGVTLSFVGHITEGYLTDVETGEYVNGVIFGGGSILYGEPAITPEALDVLLSGQIPVFYIGVGAETEVHPIHRKLMAIAQVVAIREQDMPDLVLSLPGVERHPDVTPNGILVVPNVETVPTWKDPHWKHVAWEHFKDEFSQVLDYFVDLKIPTTFLLSCSNSSQEDAWAAGEILSRMARRGNLARNIFRCSLEDASETLKLMQFHQVVVTQRYHGIILSELAGVPYISIDHHDKLKNATPSRGTHISFYGSYKAQMIAAIEDSMSTSIEPHRAPKQVFDDLADRVVDIMGRK